MSSVGNKPTKGCCGRPVFPLVTQIVSMSLGLVAFIMSAVAIAGCDFFKVTGIDLTIGLFKVGTTDTRVCYELDELITSVNVDEVVSGSWKAARAMGAVAAAFGGITSMTCFLMLFVRFPAGLFKTVGGLYIFSFVAQMLTLLVLNSELCKGEVKCKLRTDAFAGIIAAIFYLGIGVTVSVCPVPKTAVINCCGGCCSDEEGGCGDCCGEQSVQVEESRVGDTSVEGNKTNTSVTETYNANGTVTVTEEKVNPDGTVTTSITTRPATNV